MNQACGFTIQFLFFTGIVVGSVVGGMLLVVVVIAAIVYWRRKKSRVTLKFDLDTLNTSQ